MLCAQPTGAAISGSTGGGSLATWPSELERDRELCVARLASACAWAGDIDSLLDVAPTAVALAEQTGSGRINRELHSGGGT
jgi:hypothetical protein